MKTIGLIGGMSWESTVTYYKVINETVKNHLGGLHSARLILYSVDFQEIEACQANGEWDKSAQILTAAAVGLEKAGAEMAVICTNTMHKIAPQIQEHISIPILHIADAAAAALRVQNITKTALLGTRYTMEGKFYKQKLVDAGIDVLVPQGAEAKEVNRVIYEELCVGIITEESKAKFLKVIDRLKAKGAQSVILGCTEIGLLIGQKDTDLPVFDTALIHAEMAALEAIKL